MEIEQFYLGCLSHASYLVGSDGECVIVDPQRDVERYLESAGRRGMRITHVIETHLHADFVSGHRELAARTGATIVFGRAASPSFAHRAVADGDEIRVGSLTLRILETPGHTPESICVLVLDERRVPRAVLTGDTLFIGDVGRPDLAAAGNASPQDMARTLHDSLHEKLLTLPDDVDVLPAHGAGSLCGRSMSTELTSTIGAQRASNPMLAPMGRDAFASLLTAELPDQPRYFAHDARLNEAGPALLSDQGPLAALDPATVAAKQRAGATLLDVRPSEAYLAAHLRGSINVGLGGQFASWCGTLLPLDREIVLVAESEDQALEARLRLARVGLERVAGWLGGGMEAWAAAGRDVARAGSVSVAELAASLEAARVLDVRRGGEHVRAHVPGAVNLPLDRLAREAAHLDRDASLMIICQSGYRSSAAIGVLEGLGFTRLTNVTGGTGAWITAGLPVETAERQPAG